MNAERQSLMFACVLPIVVTLLSIMAFRETVADISPFLSCAETVTSHLIRVKECKYRSDKYFSCKFNRQTENGLDISSVMFVVNDIGPQMDLRHHDNITMCFGINTWTRARETYKMGKRTFIHWIQLYFEYSLTAGVLLVNRTCWKIQRLNCTLEINVRADVLSLPPLTFSLDEANFWDFSSSLLRPQLKWLIRMTLKGALQKHFPATLPGLKGSSLQWLDVDGSFGRDDHGLLPALRNLPLLKIVEMRNNALKELTPEHLLGTRNIKYFTALQNEFDKIPTGISSLKYLETLKFQSNIEAFNLTPEIFSGLQQLNSIDLSGTHIERWPQNFPFLSSLGGLTLRGCRMKSFSSSQTDFSTLILLYINRNFISHLAEDAFKGMKKVMEIDLSENLLKVLFEHTFTDLHYLRVLRLENNNLVKWPSLHSIELHVLKLSNNSLGYIFNFGSRNVTVDYLDISLNRISEWHNPHIFLKERLQDFEANQDLIPKNNIKDLSQTATQNQANSKLTAWASLVNLSGNQIEIFSEEMLYSLNVLRKVDLRGNNINCGDCRTSHLKTWLSNMTREKIRILHSSERLTCYQPEHLRGEYVQAVRFDEMCYTPRRHLWWGLGAPLLISASVFVFLIGASFVCRAEIAYLLHLAKRRSNSLRPEEDHTDCAFDVFICYSSRNRKRVTQRLNRLLEHPPECYRTCLFDRDFRMGTHIVSNAVDAINESRKAIIVLSQHFVNSKWCQWELEMANHRLFTEDGEYLVLLQLEPLERARLPRLLRFLLDTRPVVRWPRPETASTVLQAAAQLRRALGPSLSQRRVAAPRPGTSSAADESTPLLVAEAADII